MLPRKCFVTPITTVLVSLMFVDPGQPLAREAWQSKPFTEWNEKEARRITSKSPWGHTQLLKWSRGGDPGWYDDASRSESLRRDEAERSQLGRQRRPGGGGPAFPEIRVGAGEARGYGDASQGKAESYRVFWYSALRARQAIGRLRQLRGLNLEAELKTLEGQSQRHYIIAVSGPVVRFFRSAEFPELQTRTFLVSKKDKHKRIALQQYVPAKVLRFPMVLFLFSREVDGKPALELADEETTFVTEQGPVKIKVSFNLEQMMTDGRLDL